MKGESLSEKNNNLDIHTSLMMILQRGRIESQKLRLRQKKFYPHCFVKYNEFMMWHWHSTQALKNIKNWKRIFSFHSLKCVTGKFLLLSMKIIPLSRKTFFLCVTNIFCAKTL